MTMKHRFQVQKRGEMILNIRKWFGVEVNYDENKKFNISLDALLELYKEGLIRYFNLDDANNSGELVKTLKTTELDIGASLFLDWYERKGLLYIVKVASLTDFSDEQFIAEIDYEHYILKEELSYFDYPSEVRSLIISISTYLFDKVSEAA
jgi:hypothetical protein